jgi:hypothetical protein
MVVQETVMTRQGVDVSPALPPLLYRRSSSAQRILEYAFTLAASRPAKHLTSATKSNGIALTMPYWDSRVAAMSARFPDVRVDSMHIDALCAAFVSRPASFDVVVGSNLFGDILSDLAVRGVEVRPGEEALTRQIPPAAGADGLPWPGCLGQHRPDAPQSQCLRGSARLGARHCGASAPLLSKHYRKADALLACRARTWRTPWDRSRRAL